MLTSIKALDEELDELNRLITRYQSGSSKEELRTNSSLRDLSPPRQKRVRGVLAAARKAIEDLPDPFDRNQLGARLREDEEFAGKEISETSLRSALRQLTEEKIIAIERDATATSCATYVKNRSIEPAPVVNDRKKVGTGRK